MSDTTRRALLGAIGGSAAVLAGCSASPSGDGTTTEGETGATTTDPTRTTTGTTRTTPPAATGFEDDFEYPRERLPDNGWRVATGRFETEASLLLGDGRGDESAHLFRKREGAAGTVEVGGLRNRARFYGVRIAFVADARTIDRETAGYQVRWPQLRNPTVVFERLDPGGDNERLLVLSEDHDGRAADVRIERDPDSYEFTCFYDGDRVGTVRDDTYTESTYWTAKFDGPLGSQRVDRLAYRPP